MTKKRDLKSIIRERQQRTGESYCTARAHVMRERAKLVATAEPVSPANDATPPASRSVFDNFFLSSDEYAAFGLSGKEGEALYKWVFERVGYVVGADGRGGSGVFVRMLDNRIALLTARHVVTRCIFSGDVQVAANVDGKGRFKAPQSITVSTRCDAALLIMPQGFSAPAVLEPEEWDPRHYAEPGPGTHVIAAGLPGQWKTEPDVERKQINGARTLLLWTESKDVSHSGGLIECRADKTIGGLPSTFRGMSGGPLFSTKRQFLGVLESETMSEGPGGSLFSTARSAWLDLMYAWEPDGAVPPDLKGVAVGCDPIIGDTAHGTAIQLEVLADLFWSPSDPNHRYGGCARINSIRLFKGDPARDCIVNVEWIFYFGSDHQGRDRMQALEDEVRPLLAALGLMHLAPPKSIAG